MPLAPSGKTAALCQKFAHNSILPSVAKQTDESATCDGRPVAYRAPVEPDRIHAAKLTPQQREQIIRKLQPTGSYLIRMAEKMQRMGWHADDPFY
jgi:hypothetical protein